MSIERTWKIPAESMAALRRPIRPGEPHTVLAYEKLPGDPPRWKPVQVSRALILAVAPELVEEKVFAHRPVRTRTGSRRSFFRWNRPVVPSLAPTTPFVRAPVVPRPGPTLAPLNYCLPNPLPKAPLPDWVLF